MKKVILYTDGACSYNPGPGGWGCVLIFNELKKELSGFELNTTNNRMEMTAVIKGLQALKESVEVEIYSDSAYVCNAFLQGWVDNWIKNDWKTSTKKDVLNKDLWLDLIKLLNKHKYKLIKVKGHSTNFYNNRCDELATSEVKKHLNNQN